MAFRGRQEKKTTSNPDLVANVSSCFLFLLPSHVPCNLMYLLQSLVFLERTPPLYCIQRPFDTTFRSDIHSGRCASVFFFSSHLLLCPELLWKSDPDSVLNLLFFSFIVDRHSRIIPVHFFSPSLRWRRHQDLAARGAKNMFVWCYWSCRLTEGGWDSEIKKQTSLSLCCGATEC